MALLCHRRGFVNMANSPYKVEPGERSCQECLHWHKMPADPHNLSGEAKGQCRQQLHVIAVPSGPTTLDLMPCYALTPATFPACGQFTTQDEFNLAKLSLTRGIVT